MSLTFMTTEAERVRMLDDFAVAPTDGEDAKPTRAPVGAEHADSKEGE